MQVLQSQNDSSNHKFDVFLVVFNKLICFSWTLFSKGNKVSSMCDWTEIINIVLIFSTHIAFQKEGASVMGQQKIFHCDTFSQRVRFDFLFWNYLQSHFYKVCLIIGLDQINIRMGSSSYFVLQSDIKTWRSKLKRPFISL